VVATVDAEWPGAWSVLPLEVEGAMRGSRSITIHEVTGCVVCNEKGHCFFLERRGLME
jgi:hypothetical protein